MTKKIMGTMYRDGECSCCGIDRAAQFTVTSPSTKDNIIGDTRLMLCTDCEKLIVARSEFRRLKDGVLVQEMPPGFGPVKREHWITKVEDLDENTVRLTLAKNSRGQEAVITVPKHSFLKRK